MYSIINIKNFLTKGHQRTLNAKKNIIFSLAIKGFNIVIGFLLVPLTIGYLNPTKYGIWLTLSSVIGWFVFFDIGLGNGLRNKLTEALAINDHTLARIYVSTTYAILFLISSILFLLFLIINPIINWPGLLNTSPQMVDDLTKIAFIVFTFFLMRFTLQLLGTIFTADQRPALNNTFDFLSNVLSLIAIFCITQFSHGNLLYISSIYSAAPVVVLAMASLFFFNREYKPIRPSIKYINLKYFKPLAGLGINYFIIQIACLVIFSTDNLIITQVLGPSEVTAYNIAFKYFSIPIMLFFIVLTPYWSAFTEARVQNDTSWIKNSICTLVKIWLLIVIGVIFLFSISDYFYLLWVGKTVKIPILLSALMGLYAIIYTWNNIFAYFINGFGKIRLQMYYSIVAMLINIPISIFFAKQLGMGSAGVILGTCVSLTFGCIIGPVQYSKLIEGKASGVWDQ